MPTLLTLPPELIQKIILIGDLSPNDQLALSFSCAALATIVLPRFWQSLEPRKPEAWRIVRALQNNYGYRTLKIDCCAFVESIHARGVLENPLSIAYYDVLLSRTYRLQNLDISGSSGFNTDGKAAGQLKPNEVKDYLSRWLASTTLVSLDVSQTPCLFSPSFNILDLAKLTPNLTTLVILDSRVAPLALAETCAAGAWPNLVTLRYNYDTKLATSKRIRSFLTSTELALISRGCAELRTMAPGMGFLDLAALFRTFPKLESVELGYWELCPVSLLPSADAALESESGMNGLALTSRASRSVSLHVDDSWAYRSHLKKSGEVPPLPKVLSGFFNSLARSGARLTTFRYSPTLTPAYPNGEAPLAIAFSELPKCAPGSIILDDVKCGLDGLASFLVPLRNSLSKLEVATNWGTNPVEAVAEGRGVTVTLDGKQILHRKLAEKSKNGKGDARVSIDGREAVERVLEQLLLHGAC